jgi:hypothetical protein
MSDTPTPRTENAWKEFLYSGNARILAYEIATMERELAEAREQRDTAQKALFSTTEDYEKVVEQRDTLAEAMESIASGAVEEANCIKIARETLAAVKGGADE